MDKTYMFTETQWKYIQEHMDILSNCIYELLEGPGPFDTDDPESFEANVSQMSKTFRKLRKALKNAKECS